MHERRFRSKLQDAGSVQSIVRMFDWFSQCVSSNIRGISKVYEGIFFDRVNYIRILTTVRSKLWVA